MILHYIMCFAFGLFVGAIAVGGCKLCNNLEELSLLDEYCKSLEERVNALEHVIIPETQESIKYITMKLDENERSTQVRLMKVKSMMLEEAHHYSEKQ